MPIKSVWSDSDIAGCPGVFLVASDAEAAHWQRRLYRPAAGEAAVMHCSIVQVDGWLTSLWQQNLPDRHVLSGVQALVLADRVLNEGHWLRESVLDSRAVARQLLEAFQQSAMYCLPLPESLPWNSLEYRCFQEWSLAFETALEERQAIVHAQLPSAISDSGFRPRGRVFVSAELTLAPAVASLLSGWTDTVQYLPQRSVNATAQCRPCVDARAEWRCIANWAREHIVSEPAVRLAVVLMEPDADYAALGRELTSALFPQLLYPQGVADAQGLLEPWQFTGRGRLLDFPVIRAAADLVLLVAQPLPQSHWARLINSDFIDGGTAYMRSRWEWRLREEAAPSLGLATALALARRDIRGEKIDEAALESFSAVEKIVAALPGKAVASDWAGHFAELLSAGGWPNRAPGDPVVEQCVAGLVACLDTFRSFDAVLPAMSAATAGQWLLQLLQSQRFDLQRAVAPVIQVLSPEQALGALFDHVWIAGCTDRVLPAAVVRNPFLPLESLREGNVPGADPGANMRLAAEKVEAVMRCSAGSLHCSMALLNRDGLPQSPASLMNWGEPHKGVAATPSLVFDAAFTQPCEDTVAPVDEAELEQLRGGSRLFKAIADSPFIAFCEHRLKVSEFPTVSVGLQPAEQGEWLHSVLESFWAKICHSSELTALDSPAKEALLAPILDAVYFDAANLARHPRVLLQLERERGRDIILNWLSWESGREEAFEVIAREQALKTELYGIPLRLRIDRMDRVDGGHILVIDYKSGAISASTLKPESLSEPQLPIYALLGNGPEQEPVNGIALAGLADAKAAVISDWTKNLSKPAQNKNAPAAEDWPIVLEQWQAELELMAEQFKAGDIRHRQDADSPYYEYLQGFWQ